MDIHSQRTMVAKTLAQYRAGQLTRRHTLRLLAGIGATLTGAVALGTRGTGAKRVPGAGVHAGHGSLHPALLWQDAGTPPPAATPELGERSDGTRLWRVRVAGTDEENLIDAQAFFPKEITIGAGDSIFFEFPTPPGFHTVTFPSGQEIPSLFIEEATDGTTASTPPSGPAKLLLNPEVTFPSGGETIDDSGLVSSGLDVLRQPGDSFLLTFPLAGTFDYQCMPHAVVMKATVVVAETGAEVTDDQAAVDERGERERAAVIEEGKALIAANTEARATERDDGTTVWEVAAGDGENLARVLRFMPDALEVKAGDTVRWVNRSRTEPHTITFLGAGEEPPEDILIEPQSSGPPMLVQYPLTLFPQGGTVFSGQGYFNSGFVGEEFPGTHPYELTFDTPGEYPYYCILHASGPEGPGMFGTITVT